MKVLQKKADMQGKGTGTMKNIQKKGKFGSVLKYMAAFLIPVILYTVILKLQKAYPFGTNSFLYSDAYYQYYAMFQEMIGWLKSGDGSQILWNRGLGIDFTVNMLYYGMSPFNLIIFVMGESRVAFSMVLVIILKLGAMCATALYYFEHTSMAAVRRENPVVRYGIAYACSCSYVFCGYVMAYNHNLIWLDGLILLPLLAIALERLNEKNRIFMYYSLLTLAFVTNFYFSFYVCVFAVIYFLLLERENWKQFIKKSLVFAGVSVLAACTSAVVLLPVLHTVLNISASGAENQIGFFSVGNLCDFWESFYPVRSLDAEGPSIFTHNNYCGTIIFLLTLFFFLDKGKQRKRKLKFAAALLFLIAGLNFSGLNYVMHGFAFTHGMGNRFAFILLFILLVMAFQVLSEYEPAFQVTGLIGIVCIFVLFAVIMILNPEKGNPYSYIAFLMLMTLYVALLVFYWRKSIRLHTFYLWLVMIWLAELLVNAVMVAPDKVMQGSFDDSIHLSEWEQEYDALVCAPGERKSALCGEIYMRKSDVNWYSSLIDKHVIDSFKSLGLSHYQNIEYTYRGTSRLTALMYNVRYVLTSEKGCLGGYHELAAPGTCLLYEADELASMGFMMDADILQWTGTDTAAMNQNAFAKLAFDADPLFYETDISGAEISCKNMVLLNRDDMHFEYEGKGFLSPCLQIDFTADQDMDLYVESSDTSLQALTVVVNDEIRIDTLHVETESLLPIGKVQKGDRVSILHYGCADEGERAEKNIRLYTFEDAAFDRMLPNLLDEILTVDSVKGDTLKGNIHVKEAGVLYIALPYRQGYTVTVDGVETKPLKIGTGLMGVSLEPGDHQISIRYETPGLKAGMLITGLSVLFAAGLGIVRKKKLSGRV